MSKICFEFPDKKRYNFQKDAEAQIFLSENSTKLRSYYCQTCKGWHLTSK